MINVTPAAASKISELLIEENKQSAGLRVFVQGGGCSGFQYGLMIDEGEGDATTDAVIESNGVKGGGCSGLSYTFAWEKQPRLGDEVFEGPEGSKIFVDKKSLLFLNGTVLDYDTNLVSKGFVFNNPNAKSTCGCGSSFGA